MTTAADHPVSRRAGRPPRLTLDRVVRGAIDLVDEAGLDALSMPRLAKRLGVGTMTLYGYVANKQGLLDGMAAALLSGIAPVGEGPWEARLCDYLRRFRRVALAHPALAALLATGGTTIPTVGDHLEVMRAAMEESGLDAEVAARTLNAALCFTLGFVVWEIPPSHMQPAEVALDIDEQFEWGLAAILRAPIANRRRDR